MVCGCSTEKSNKLVDASDANKYHCLSKDDYEKLTKCVDATTMKYDAEKKASVCVCGEGKANKKDETNVC